MFRENRTQKHSGKANWNALRWNLLLSTNRCNYQSPIETILCSFLQKMFFFINLSSTVCNFKGTYLFLHFIYRSQSFFFHLFVSLLPCHNTFLCSSRIYIVLSANSSRLPAYIYILMKKLYAFMQLLYLKVVLWAAKYYDYCICMIIMSYIHLLSMQIISVIQRVITTSLYMCNLLIISYLTVVYAIFTVPHFAFEKGV